MRLLNSTVSMSMAVIAVPGSLIPGLRAFTAISEMCLQPNT